MSVLLHLINPNFGITEKQEKRLAMICLAVLIASVVWVMVDPTFAAGHGKTPDSNKSGGSSSGNGSDLPGILNTIISKVIVPMFIAIGVILGVYSIGQLILAFKNEDADSKSRASQLLVVAIALVSFSTIVTATDLTSKIMSINN